MFKNTCLAFISEAHVVTDITFQPAAPPRLGLDIAMVTLLQAKCLLTYKYQTRVVLEHLSLSRSGLLRESSLGRICHATTTKAITVTKLRIG
jgi:hypothetical protein